MIISSLLYSSYKLLLIFIMARPLRLEYLGALYYLTARGNAQQDIYLTD